MIQQKYRHNLFRFLVAMLLSSLRVFRVACLNVKRKPDAGRWPFALSGPVLARDRASHLPDVCSGYGGAPDVFCYAPPLR